MRTAISVDKFIANSHYIAARVRNAYNRNADVIYPPVDVESFVAREDKDDYYVTASRLVPYKKVDLVVEAFAGMPEKRLVVIGDGPSMPGIRAKAGRNVSFLGHLTREELARHLQAARAFIFAAEEDFGILPVEAQACGTPVIAFGRGGVTESVIGLDFDDPTGLFFDEQSAAAIRTAVTTFETMSPRISPSACRRNAERFSVMRFRESFSAYICKAAEMGKMEKADRRDP
ncbi:MAG TPA: glycosyltransferase [Anaerolineales bacterium]|nr:glycosyltransferase [Anaerolineales bacterium]